MKHLKRYEQNRNYIATDSGDLGWSILDANANRSKAILAKSEIKWSDSKTVGMRISCKRSLSPLSSGIYSLVGNCYKHIQPETPETVIPKPKLLVRRCLFALCVGLGFVLFTHRRVAAITICWHANVLFRGDFHTEDSIQSVIRVLWLLN